MAPTRRLTKLLLLVAGGAGLVVLILLQGGFLSQGKIQPGRVPPPAAAEPPAETFQAVRKMVVEYYQAVGTVRPRTETSIEARVTGRVLEMRARPGQKVDQGELLVVLDDRESQTRLERSQEGLKLSGARREQARQAVAAAEAAFAQARQAYQRIKGYLKSEAATPQQLEEAESAFLQAQARLSSAKDGLTEAQAAVRQAEKVVEEARIGLSYTRITAPEAGQVAKRMAEPGDLAWPGKPLVVLQTSQSLRLEALVREGLVHLVGPGTELAVDLPALEREVEGRVEELVPSADPLTRTFLVKVAVPALPGLFPGMFGRLKVAKGEREVILIPRAAVLRVGQLEMVLVRTKEGTKEDWQRILIKTGREVGEMVEVLSGLEGGEVIGRVEGQDG